MLQRVFFDHPASVDETYGQHMGVAWGFAGQLLSAAVMCFLHGLLPCCFTTSASQRITKIHDSMVLNRIRVEANVSPIPARETAQ